MVILLISIGLFLSYLIIERIRIKQHHRAIPFRITVTGTRGKTAVVRLLASVLRENSNRVIAKTTGSTPRLILPDGSEKTIKRRGSPNILEQKKLLNWALKERADILVSEVMSIHPENHFIESQKMLKPHIVVLTNIRSDHMEAVGSTDQDAADTFSLDFSGDSHVFLPRNEMKNRFTEVGKQNELVFHTIPADFSKKKLDYQFNYPFSENLDLVVAVASHLGIKPSIIKKGIQNTIHDQGSLGIWVYQSEASAKSIYLVNGFAANEPASTKEALDKVKSILPSDISNWIGILNCRGDRGDRTRQWIFALKTTAMFDFSQLYVIGDHTHAVKRFLPHSQILKEKKPGSIMQIILDQSKDKSVVFGLGNWHGLGEKMTVHWMQTGEKYGI